MNLPTDYEKKMTLTELKKGSMMHSLANAHINHGKGYYTCTYNGYRTLIVK